MRLSFRRRRLVWVLLAVVLVGGQWVARRLAERPSAAPTAGSSVAEAFEGRRSGVMLKAAGVVERLLADDLEGDRHQRFILRLASGHTLLVSHNIDLAPRVPARPGERLEVRGQYEWNQRGGVVHWTHHDPRGRRPGGWIRHAGEIYR